MKGKSAAFLQETESKKFDGELNETIQEMFPILGVNKYIVMNANGMEVVRFVK